MAGKNKPDMGWIRGALRGEIQKKIQEAGEAKDRGDEQGKNNALRIAAEWQTVYDDSDPTKESE